MPQAAPPKKEAIKKATNSQSVEARKVEKVSNLTEKIDSKPEIVKKAPEIKHTFDPNVAVTLGQLLGVDKLRADGIREASKRYGINPKYRFVGYWTENLRNPYAIGDKGCSYGAYQMNMCAGDGSRPLMIHVGKPLKECALDPYCSADWVGSQMLNVYGCKLDKNGNFTNPTCLSRHQGAYPDDWYVRKVEKGLKNVDHVLSSNNNQI